MHEKEKISSNSEAILGYAKLGFENNIIEKMGSRNTTFPTWNGEFQVGITHSYRSTTPSHQPPSSLWNFWTLKYFLLIYFISKKSLSHLYGASNIRMEIA